jgi:15-cis-phytoene synthase
MLSRPEPLVCEARATTRRSGRTFALACRLLPHEVRDDVHLLYLVFRSLDDAVDGGAPDAEERVAAVEAWARGSLAPTPFREVRILADLAGRHTIPRAPVVDFCLGMREDLEAAAIATESELDRYCYRVAGTVGVVMAALLGTDRPADDAAAALGMAMQRTNILRDIDEDLANGRVYLAEETLMRFGSLAPGRREALLRDQIARADALYEEGIAGICRLRRGRRAIAAAAAMYREILRQIEREGYGARPGRTVVPRHRKMLVAARAGGP